jgi:thiol-disulfide isomerase/thioredoxin
MLNLRNLVLVASLFMLSALNAFAAERFTYELEAFQAALNAGKPILVHVTAPWCPECKAQKPIVAALAERPEYKGLTIFEVDFDTQKDALRGLRVQKESTLVIYKGKAEVARAVGITKREAIETLMKRAL